jgi:phospholipid transport system substrate-binding protein
MIHRINDAVAVLNVWNHAVLVLWLSASLTVAVLWALPAQAQQDLTDDARTFMEQFAQRALTAIERAKVSEREATEALDEVLTKAFDLPLIGRFVIGRHWNGATDEQRRDYLALFQQMLVLTYVVRFRDFGTFDYNIKQISSRNEREVIVDSVIKPAGSGSIDVQWRLRRRGGRWRVVDVNIAGLSMLLVQRDEVGGMIRRHGGDMDKFLAAIRAQLGRVRDRVNGAG